VWEQRGKGAKRPEPEPEGDDAQMLDACDRRGGALASRWKDDETGGPRIDSVPKKIKSRRRKPFPRHAGPAATKRMMQ